MSLGGKSDQPKSHLTQCRVRSNMMVYSQKNTLDNCKAVEIAASLRFLIHFLVTTVIVVVIVVFNVVVVTALVKCVERNEIVTKLGLLNCGRLNVISSRGGGSRFRTLQNRRRRGSCRSRTRLSFPVGTDNMREFATLGGASTLLGKIRAFPYVLFRTVEANCAIA